MLIFAKIRGRQVFVEKNRFSWQEKCQFLRQSRQMAQLGADVEDRKT